MPFKSSGPTTGFREIDRWDGGVGWLAYPEEEMQRASHALATDDGIFVVDPVDAEPVDDLLAEFGSVAGVVVLLDRHLRDAATVANRHDAPVFVPEWMTGVAGELDAPVERFGDRLADTTYESIAVVDWPGWQEAALWNHDDGTLVVPETVGTSSYFCARGERLGVHPMLRLLPPRRAFVGVEPERVLVGHGVGVFEDADDALRDALDGSRRRAPGLYAKTVKSFVFG